jgi:segregation and condensation protein B
MTENKKIRKNISPILDSESPSNLATDSLESAPVDSKSKVSALAEAAAALFDSAEDLSEISWQFKDDMSFAEDVSLDENILPHEEALAGEELELATEQKPIDEFELQFAETAKVLEADSQSNEVGDELGGEVEEKNSDLPFEFVDQERLYSILESLLFSYDKPVSLSLMREAFRGTNIKSKDLQRALDVLASKYAAADRGVMLEEIAGGYQVRTKPDNAQFLLRMTKERPFKLTGPSLEVLSIVAYKQPIVKSEIDQIRGVESGHLLRALMDRGLINFQGKSELPGKPMQYGTARKFLEIFGLRNLRELPSLSEIDQLIPEGIGDPEDEKRNLSDITDELATQFTGSYSEGESELIQITDQLSEIHTSSDFFENEKKREKEKRDRERAEDIAEAMMLGTNVEAKDVTWLKRYEAKQIEIALQAEAASVSDVVAVEEPVGIEEEIVFEEVESLSESLSSEDHEPEV